MSSVDTNSALSGLYWDTSTTKSTTESNNNGALTQSDFFALLTQQLAYQDPTNPVENNEMINQMTSFTMADGINSLNENFANFANSMTSSMALQASSLVGRSVLTTSNDIVFTGETLSRGYINLDSAADTLKVRIENSSGEVVSTFSVANPSLGKNEFVWDGTNSDGETLAAGVYKIYVEASANGETQTVPVNVYTPVTSVSLAGTNGITLNLLGLGTVKLSDVLEVSYS